MPNHVTNEIIFRGVDRAAQEKIVAIICNADRKVDFEVLVPLPLNMWWGSVGTKHEKAFKRTALDWALENWGTKWGAYQQRATLCDDSSITFCFDTAWSPPYPWLAAVFNSSKLSFEHNYFNEGEDWSVSGVFDYSKRDDLFGAPWNETRATHEVHKRLHVLKYGCESFPPEDEEEGIEA